MGSWIENELIELINSDQFRLSIPIQFQFKIFQFNSNSIHAELNWIDYQFQFNSWIDPSPALQQSLSRYDRVVHQGRQLWTDQPLAVSLANPFSHISQVVTGGMLGPSSTVLVCTSSVVKAEENWWFNVSALGRGFLLYRTSGQILGLLLLPFDEIWRLHNL